MLSGEGHNKNASHKSFTLSELNMYWATLKTEQSKFYGEI